MNLGSYIIWTHISYIIWTQIYAFTYTWYPSMWSQHKPLLQCLLWYVHLLLQEWHLCNLAKSSLRLAAKVICRCDVVACISYCGFKVTYFNFHFKCEGSTGFASFSYIVLIYCVDHFWLTFRSKYGLSTYSENHLRICDKHVSNVKNCMC